MEQQTAPVKKQRILSGIQPSGTPTLGNYIGAMRNWKLLEDQYDCLYMIADLHAITVRQEPAKLRAQSIQLLALLLARVIKTEHIREKSDYLLGNLPFFFIPASVSIINYAAASR